MGGIVTLNRGKPTPPPEAAAVGYTSLLLFDDFNSISTIDINNTQAPGFNWYVQSFANLTEVNVNPADLSVANSLAVLTGHSSTIKCQLKSIYPTGSHGYAGNHYSGSRGFYMECRMSFNPALSPGGGTTLTPSWPAFWTESDDLLGAEEPPINPGVTGVEMDILEAFPISAGAVDSRMYDFLLQSTSTGQTVLAQASNNVPPASIPNYNNLNEFGVLVVPMARNGGTGYAKRFINRTYIPLNAAGTSMDLTWTPSSTWSHIEADDFAILLATGLNWPTTYDYVAVWGPP